MLDLGTVRPGTTIYIPFHTFDSNDPAASTTITGLATTDIEVYKDGSVTQRASDSGYALLDTDGIDFDTTTGIHGFSIDLADNTTAGFWAAGSQYWVVIASVTVDAATVNFIAATFRIGYPDALINTTIATLASQTSFTLTSGPAENDALNGCVVWIHDVASAVQCGHAIISDYVGSTKTVTLAAGTTFTAAATDNIAIFPPALLPTTAGNTLSVDANGRVDVASIAGTAQTARDIGASVLLSSGTGTGQVSLSSGTVTVGTNNDKTGYSISGTLTTLDALDTAQDTQHSNTQALIGTPTDFGSGTSTIAANLQDMADNGTATFDRSTDSLQALRDHIADGTNLTEAGGTGDHLTAVATAASISALNDLSAAQVNAEVVDALNTDTYAEPGQGTPGATISLAAKIGYLYKAWRNRSTQNATTYNLYNDDGTTVGQTATVSDDGTTADKGEVTTGV